MARWLTVLAALGALSCNPAPGGAPMPAGVSGPAAGRPIPGPAQAPPKARVVANVPEEAQAGAAQDGRDVDAPAVRPEEPAAVFALAAEYAAFLAKAKTPRRSVAALMDLVRSRASEAAELPLPGPGSARRGEQVAPAPAAAKPGQLYWLASPTGDAVAFVRVGRRPLKDGLRIVVAAMDAPRFALKPKPVYDAAALTMLETLPVGEITMEAWLSQPLALSIYMPRQGKAPVDILVGDADRDPVLVIPDLLPHLSRRVQRDAIVDKPERMNAVAARSQKALVDFLRSRGLGRDDLAIAEAALVPAGPPRFVGLDRALLAGYGHSHRGLAYAAARALAESGSAEHWAMVVAVRYQPGAALMPGGMAFLNTAMLRVIGAFADKGEHTDVLETRRIYARSAVLLSHELEGALGKGIVLGPSSDDAVPTATRAVLDTLRAAGVSFQLAGRGQGSMARELMAADMDVVVVGLPTRGRGSPRELIATRDLYQAFLAASAWLTQP